MFEMVIDLMLNCIILQYIMANVLINQLIHLQRVVHLLKNPIFNKKEKRIKSLTVK